MAAVDSNEVHTRDPTDQDFDYMFKLLITGNSSVGKTSFLYRYSDDSFTSAFVATVGIDFKVQTVFRNNKKIKLQIWDTAGQERYRTITTAYFRGAMGFLLMYDISDEESFKDVVDWADRVKSHSRENTQVVLIGNKCDIERERAVTFEQGKQLADSLGFPFLETSAKDNINVRNAFDKLVDVIYERMTDTIAANCSGDTTLGESKRGITTLKSDPNEGEGCSCSC